MFNNPSRLAVFLRETGAVDLREREGGGGNWELGGRENCRDVIYEIRINEIKCDMPYFFQAVFPWKESRPVATTEKASR